METVYILGVRIDNVTLGSAMTRIETFLREGGMHQVSTVNPEFVILAQSDPNFMHLLNQTALNVPDGVGLFWAARRLGEPLRERVTGQELVECIAALAAERGYAVFLLGAREGIAERAAAALVARHPHLKIAGCYAGSPAPAEDESLIARVNASHAQVLFVAYGPPQQEIWIARNAARLQSSVAMGVGGTFDTLAGIVPRAPLWVQHSGFEWTFRLLREPRRFRRQLAIPYFMLLTITKGKKV